MVPRPGTYVRVANSSRARARSPRRARTLPPGRAEDRNVQESPALVVVLGRVAREPHRVRGRILHRRDGRPFAMKRDFGAALEPAKTPPRSISFTSATAPATAGVAADASTTRAV